MKLSVTKLFVGTYEFPIALVKRGDVVFTIDADDDEDPSGTHGITHFEEPQRGIYVCDDLKLPELLEVIMHEITHAVNHAAGFDGSGIEEESIAEEHGKIWSQFWLHNPTFSRWWMSRCADLRKDMGLAEVRHRGSAKNQ